MIILYFIIVFLLLAIAALIFRWRGTTKDRIRESREQRFHHVGPGEIRQDEPPRSTGIN
jgi:hypothetical protein